MRPLERTGNSANITYYRERGAQPESYVWVEVLETGYNYRRESGQLVVTVKPASDYHIAVRRAGSADELAEFTYTPKRGRGELSPRTVARLVRARLEPKEA